MSDADFRLSDWRKFRRLSAVELAAKSGLSPGYISQLETGRRRYTQRALEALASALGCTTSELLGQPPVQPAAKVVPWKHPEAPAGHYIRAWREHRGLTQTELANMVGISHANLSRIERGKIPYGQKVLEGLASALSADPGRLITMLPASEANARYLENLAPSRRAQLAEIAQILAREPHADDLVVLEAATESRRRLEGLAKERATRAQRRTAAQAEAATAEKVELSTGKNALRISGSGARLSDLSLAKLKDLQKFRRTR